MHFIVAGKVAKMVTEGTRNSRVQVSATAEAHGLADVVDADSCLGIDALYAGETTYVPQELPAVFFCNNLNRYSRSAVAVNACVVASLSRSDFEDIERVISRYIAQQLTLFLKVWGLWFGVWGLGFRV